MNRLGIIFIFSALIIAAILTGLMYKHQKNKPVVSDQQTKVNVLVAAKNLQRGTALTDQDVSWQPWPNYVVSPTYIVEGVRKKETLIGSILKEPVFAGQPITDHLLIAKENLSPLAGELDPGMRAFTIDVSIASALGGLLKPGDTVDVILSYTLNRSGGAEKKVITATLLHGINVLGVDQEISSGTAGTKSTGKVGSANTKNVTLEVTPKQAEILAWGRSMGSLSLSLSSPSNESAKSSSTSASSLDDLLNMGNSSIDKGNISQIHGDKIDQAGSDGS